jgi:D-alanine transaminase
MSLIYLNGEFVPLETATISVLDRGFIFGDGVYEVIPVYKGRPLALEPHLDRLDRSLAGIRLKNPLTRSEWQKIIEQLLSESPQADQSLYLHITRGVAPRDHAFPAGVKPTVMAIAKPMAPVPPAWLESGIATISHEDFRWTNCHLKTIALLPNILLRQLAVDQGAVETILLRDGYLTEGAASNILVVKEGHLLCPPRNNMMLTGITLELTLDVARSLNIPVEERPISEAELRAADELLLTSSTREIVPITTLDGQNVGSGKPGPVGRALLTQYQSLK